MNVNFPANCNKESSRWSFTVKINEVLRLWHNENCVGMTAKQSDDWRKANFKARINAVMQARNEQIEIARVGTYWNPRIPDHVSDGNITYPAGLNQTNEGSRGSFLIGLGHKLNLAGKDINDIDVQAVNNALTQAKEDAINGSYWNPSLEDIVED